MRSHSAEVCAFQELPLSFANLQALRWLDLKKNPLQPELLKVASDPLLFRFCVVD